jgi:hypothetical protein
VTGVAGTNDLECDDIKAGHWDGATFHAWNGPTYVPAAMEIDAVQVQTHRAQVNANPLQLFFAAALGLAETDINTTAVATTGGGQIPNGCLIALNNETGVDETFKLNGGATVTTVGCDIRVDQCCTYEGGCQKGALRAVGNPEILVVAEPCAPDELNCVPEYGRIDVCGSVLSTNQVSLDPDPDCTYDPEGSPNLVQCADEPSYDTYDPLTQFAEDNSQDWAGLAASPCDYGGLANGNEPFSVTDLGNQSSQYYSPEDVETVTEPVLDADGNQVYDPDTGEPLTTTTTTYTLYPGTYCGNGTNTDAIKFAGGGGGGSGPNIIFSDDGDGQGVYVIKDGQLDFGSTGDISCDPCGFFLTGDPVFAKWEGSNSIDMTASADPDSPLFGLLMVQDPYASDPDPYVKIHGSNDGGYYGGFYLPDAHVDIAGTVQSNSNELGDCLYIISDTMEFEGTSDLNANNSCGAFGGTSFSPSPLFFTLVN